MSLIRAAQRDGDEAGPPHPAANSSLVGHAAAETALLSAYQAGRLHHAWLIGGAEGVGKAMLAWRFVKFILAHPDPGAPEVQAAADLAVRPDHPVVARLLAGSLGDAAVLERQWNDKTKKLFSEIRVDDVRRVTGLFQQASSSGGYRICIIDTAEDLNRSSANALLKIVEEPPPRSLFLILAHRPSQIMPTIASRCRRLILPPLSVPEVENAVRGLGSVYAALPRDQIAAAAHRSNGSVGRAIALLQGERIEREAAVERLLGRLPAIDWRTVHGLADTIGMSDDEFAVVAGAILDWLNARVRAEAVARRPRDLAPFADAWTRARQAIREAEVLNLDKRPVLLGLFADLADLTRTA